MKARQPTVLSSLVGRMPGVSSVLAQAGMLRTLNRQLHQCLPDELAAHCAVANVNGDTLVLVADAPHWAGRLRYMAHPILRHIGQGHKPELTRLRVRIAPLPPEPPPRPAPRGISETTAASLRQLADDVGDDELGQALRRLAAHNRDQ